MQSFLLLQVQWVHACHVWIHGRWKFHLVFPARTQWASWLWWKRSVVSEDTGNWLHSWLCRLFLIHCLFIFLCILCILASLSFSSFQRWMLSHTFHVWRQTWLLSPTSRPTLSSSTSLECAQVEVYQHTHTCIHVLFSQVGKLLLHTLSSPTH